MTRRGKFLAKDMRAYILVGYVIDGETWLHYIVSIYVSYLSYMPVEQLDDG